MFRGSRKAPLLRLRANCFCLPSSDLTFETNRWMGCVKEEERLCEEGWVGWEDMPYPGPAAIMCIQLSWATPFFLCQVDGREVVG